MVNKSGFIIRNADLKDLDLLISFFRKAYGDKTIFQDAGFLNYYFTSFTNKTEPLSANLIAVDEKGEIISHYGGLNYLLKLDDEVISGYWGVNAYTLPDWRGKGINTKMVNAIAANNDFNAVIGMPFEAPFFYKKFDYNIFNKETLSRFVYAISEATYKTVDYLGNNVDRANELIRINDRQTEKNGSPEIIDLTINNYDVYDYDLIAPVKATTYRSKGFLTWRVFRNPYVNYTVFGYNQKNRIISYVVMREEILKPQNYRVARIIDLFGKVEMIEPLLKQIIQFAQERDSIYIDFSVFGNLYDEILINNGFNKLDDDDCCLLPQVSAPVENRPNHEFIVLQSTKFEKKIDSLTKESVYFTRIDGDRDRIAQLSQIKR